MLENLKAAAVSMLLSGSLALWPAVLVAGVCTPDRSTAEGSAPYVTYTSGGGLIFISGQIGIDPGSEAPLPAFDTQMSRALARLDAALEAAGSSAQEVLRTTVYLSDPANIPRMNELYRDFFASRGAPLPARSLVPGLDFGGAIAFEIDAIARHLPCEAPVRSSYVSVPVIRRDPGAEEDPGTREYLGVGSAAGVWVAGNLRYPLVLAQPAPAVLILHGSAGVDSRGELHARALNAAGIVTLELDLWAARGWMAARSGRPAGVPETLPDAFAALQFLASLPEVDGAKIGVMGFSWGGVMTMLSAAEKNIEELGGGLRFAAHAPFYPVCWAYDRVPGYELETLSPAPLLLQTGAMDDYDEPGTCPELARRYGGVFEVVVYADAHHGFNALGADVQLEDPFSHLGRGGLVRFRSDPVARAESVARTTAFFQQALAPAASAAAAATTDVR